LYFLVGQGEHMTAGDWVRRLLPPRWSFTLSYLRGWAPWDSGIAPPELVRVVEGGGHEHREPGRALDLGCGTGTNCLYLARHGWEATGVDFAEPAIARAREKAAVAGQLSGSTRFLRGDVTRLESLGLRGTYHLIFDLGCLHVIPPVQRPRYAAGIARLAAPGALFLLYAFGPTRIGARQVGLTADEVRATFALGWALKCVEPGQDRGNRTSAWYWLQRQG
jgi:SAM-dependent methyltransferase